MSRLDGSDALRLLEAVVIPTLLVDGAGCVRWANPAAERLLAWPRDLLSDQPLPALFAARFHAVDDRPLHVHLAEHAARTPERPYRLSALRRDGVEHEVDCVVSRFDGDHLVLSLQRRPESFGDDEHDDERRAESRYRLVFEYAPLGIWHFDERGVITACNEVFVRVIGSSKRALIGLDQTTLGDKFIVDCVRIALSGRHTYYEGDYRSATAGKVTPVRADFAAIRDESGRVVGGVGILEDITARKLAEEALRESNSALRAIFEASPLPIVAIAADGNVRMWNPAAERTFGWRQDEVVGARMPNIPPEHGERVPARFSEVAAGSVMLNVETYLLRRDGSRVAVSLSAAPLQTRPGDSAGIIAVIADNTERNLAMAERAGLLAQEQQARRDAEAAQSRLEILATASAIIASSLDLDEAVARAARMATPRFAQQCVVWLLDDEGKLLLAAANLEGAGPTTLDTPLLPLARPPRDLPLPGTLADHAGVASVIQLGRSRRNSRGIVAPLVVLGRTLGAIGFARDEREPAFDAADLHLAEEIGRRAGVAIDNARLFRKSEDALRARDEFLSIASHELRTPVTSLRLSIQNLESMAQEGSLATAPLPMVIRALQTSVRQSQHLGRLIDELLDMSRLRADRFDLARGDVDLAQLARSVVQRLERELTMASCLVDLDLQPAPGRWDPVRLDQVVTNLLTNAMKFGAGKPLSIRVRAEGGVAVLSVRDRGIGIAPEAQARIFDRFERGVSAQHYGGLGLGLYIARQIVEAHGGRIEVESQVGDGATFTVTLPSVVHSADGGGR